MISLFTHCNTVNGIAYIKCDNVQNHINNKYTKLIQTRQWSCSDTKIIIYKYTSASLEALKFINKTGYFGESFRIYNVGAMK